MPFASIPLPDSGLWRLGPVTIRAWALCIIAAIGVGVAVTRARTGRGAASRAQHALIWDVAAWAVPFGLLGAAAHAVLVATRHDFLGHRGLWHALITIDVAIGVPGAVALGTAGAWIACRRAGKRLDPVAGAAAPGVAFALAIGGLGHWWAQDFYGRPASWWLAERIAPEHRVAGYENYATFQPAFVYQSLWDVAVGVALIWASRRFSLTGARTFLLGAAAYAAGGLWVESVRIGPQPRILGVPYDVWADSAVFVAAVVLLWLLSRRPAAPALAGATAGKVISV